MLESMWRKENPPAMRTSLVVQTVKHLPTVKEIQVQSLGGEDLLEKEMATHSSILAWKIQWMEELGRLQSMESQRGIGWRGRWEGGSGWERHVNPWLIHVNV